MLWSTVPLALGIAGDTYVVFAKVRESQTDGAIAGVVVLAGFLGLWFGYNYLVARSQGSPVGHGQPLAVEHDLAGAHRQ